MTRHQQIQARAAALAHAGHSRHGVAVAATEPSDQGQTTAELWLYGVVGGYWFGFNDKDVADQLRGLSVDHITVRLNSPGGDSVQGIAIGNLLRNHKASVTVVVDGLAASAASILALGGDEIVMSPGSQMMIHDPWFFTMGNAAELRQDADFLDKQGANMASVYALRAGGTAEEWRTAMTAPPDGTWYSADEAVEAKLADRVGTVVAVGAAPQAPAVVPEDDQEDVAARAAWDLEVLLTPAARAAWSAAGAPKPPTASAGGNTHTQGGSAVAFSDEQMTNLRGSLGLAETADEAAIVAAVNAVVEESLEERPETTTPQSTSTDGSGLSAATLALLGLPASADDAAVAAAFAEIRGGAQAGAQAAERLRIQERDTFLNEHRDRFTPAARTTWEAEYDRNPQATRDHLAQAEVIVPLEPLGHGVAATESSTNDDGWFPGYASASAAATTTEG